MTSVLILHGWGWPISSPQWARVKELLETAGYEVFLPDLPGFGQTPSPKEPWAIDDYVEWVKNFCEKNNLSQIFLLVILLAVRWQLNFQYSIPRKSGN